MVLFPSPNVSAWLFPIIQIHNTFIYIAKVS